MTMWDADQRREAVLYRQGVDQLVEVYRLAFDAMADKRLEYRNMNLRMDNDSLYAEELHARNAALTSEADIRFAIERNEEAVQVLYQAFLMALYHHWERTLVRWMKKPSGYKEKYAWLKQHGNTTFEEDKLEELRILLRLVKHESAGTELRERRPDLFKGEGTTQEDLYLRPFQMYEFFDALLDAGLIYVRK